MSAKSTKAAAGNMSRRNKRPDSPLEGVKNANEIRVRALNRCVTVKTRNAPFHCSVSRNRVVANQYNAALIRLHTAPPIMAKQASDPVYRQSDENKAERRPTAAEFTMNQCPGCSRSVQVNREMRTRKPAATRTAPKTAAPMAWSKHVVQGPTFGTLRPKATSAAISMAKRMAVAPIQSTR